MDHKYAAFACRLRARMQTIGITSNRDLQARLKRAKADCGIDAETGENMISRWVTGRARPWGHRLEALLDILGVMDEADRNEWKAAAYGPAPSSNRPTDDELDNPQSGAL